MNDLRRRLGRNHPWSTCSAELPHRTLDDVRRTVFVMPAMHLIIPLPAPVATDVPSHVTDEQAPSPVAPYQWANSEAADSLRWRKAGSNAPLMRTRFITPESETR